MLMVAWANQGLLDYGQSGLGYDGCELIVGHIDGALERARIGGAKRGCFAIGAVKQDISGSDTGIRRRFFVQHNLGKYVEGFNCVLARKLLDVVGRSRSTTGIAAHSWLKASVHLESGNSSCNYRSCFSHDVVPVTEP